MRSAVAGRVVRDEHLWAGPVSRTLQAQVVVDGAAGRAVLALDEPLSFRGGVDPAAGVRDCVYGEDACLTRTGHGPANRASLDNIALAVIFANRRGAESLAETRRRLQLDRREAIVALTRP